MSWHSLDLTAGPYSWHVEPGDPAAVGDLLDNLSVETNIDEEHPIAGPFGPKELKFGIIVDQLAELADLKVGDRVSCVCRRAPDDTLMPWSAPGTPDLPVAITAGSPTITTYGWVKEPQVIAQVGWANTAGDVLSVHGGHGLAVGDVVRFRDPALPLAISLPDALSVWSEYYVKQINDPEFFVISKTPAGAALVISEDFQDLVMYRQKRTPAPVEHGLVVGQRVWFNSLFGLTSSAPTGLTAFRQYTVAAVPSSTTIQLSDGPGQPTITPTTAGHGYHYLTPIGDVPENVYVPPLIQYAGTVTELNARRRRDGRVVVDVHTVDRLADLANITVGTTAYPAELCADRLSRLFNEAGIPVPSYFIYGVLAAREARPVSLLEAAQEILSWSTGQLEGDGVFYLVCNYAFYFGDDFNQLVPYGALDPKRPYAVGQAYKRHVAGNERGPRNLPLVLAETPAGWAPVMDPQPEDVVLPASLVELEAAWRKSRSKRVDRAVVSGPGASGNGETWWQEFPGAVPIEWRVDTELSTSENMQALVRVNLPDQTPEQWALDEITLADEMPLSSYFPLSFIGGYDTGIQRYPIYLAGLEPAQDPNGRGWFGGMIGNARVELVGGSYVVEQQITPEVPMPYNYPGTYSTTPGSRPPFLAPVWLADTPELAALTAADLDPTLTPYELRGVRRPDPS